MIKIGKYFHWSGLLFVLVVVSISLQFLNYEKLSVSKTSREERYDYITGRPYKKEIIKVPYKSTIKNSGVDVKPTSLEGKATSHESKRSIIKAEANDRIFLNKANKITQQGTPASRVGFLKIDKCSSSTITGILLRYSVRHNLTFALPEDNNVYISSYDALDKRQRENGFDILALHTVNKNLFDRLVGNDHLRIAVVREPLKRMISAAYYYRDVAKHELSDYLHKVPKQNFIGNLINKPDVYEPKKAFSFTKNAMADKFGFPTHTKITDTDVIKRHLERLNLEFKLVLVTERLDESLVLMKRLFNWTLNDIIYASRNVYSHESVNVSVTEVKKFRETSFLDYAIYENFSNILDKRINAIGNEFQAEVNHFKFILERVTKFCKEKLLSSITIEKSFWNDRFLLFREDCSLIVIPHALLIDKVIRKNQPKF